MTGHFGGDEPASERQLAFDDYFVAGAGRRELSASDRIANANRIAAGHATLQQPGPLSRQQSVGPSLHLLGAGRTPRGASTVSSRVWISVLVVVAVVLALAVVRTGSREAAALGVGDGVFGTVSAQPPTRDFPHPIRILAAPAPVAGTGGYTVLDQHGGSPVTWDPCQPIHFVVRASGAFPGGRVVLDQAMAEISKETGLFFMDDGATTEAPSPQRNPYQPDRYGQRWAPVLISWSDPNEYPALAGDVVGLAGPIAVGGKDAHIVSGEVVFDAPDLTNIENLPQGATYAYDVMLHELGHLVGLGHINDPNSIMNPVSSRPLSGYAPGDLRGLAVLGSGRCLTKA